jgi:hypothetical protein
VALGDPEYDAFARLEIRSALRLLTEHVQQVVWLTAPPIDQGRNGIGAGAGDPASDPARLIRWNELVQAEIERYPTDRATMVDLRAWFEALPNGPFDSEIRPDGVHIADSQAPVVGRWLADEILAVWAARGGRTAD